MPAVDFDTSKIQISLLNIFTNDYEALRKHSSTVQEAWFTKDTRKFIYRKIIETHKKSKSLYTEDVFHCDIETLVQDETERSQLRIEWNIFRKKPVVESADVLVDRLMEISAALSLTEVVRHSSELLEKGDIRGARSEFTQAALTPLDENDPHVAITEYEDLLQEIDDKREHPETFNGILTGFDIFDEKVGGLFPAELTLIAAITGVGKSTMMKQVGYNVMMQGKNVLHITNEENKKQVRLKYHSLITEINYYHLKNPAGKRKVNGHLVGFSADGRLSEEERRVYAERIEKFSNNRSNGQLIIKEIPSFTDMGHVERCFFELKMRGIDIDLIIIDYLDQMQPKIKAHNENDEQAKIAAEAKSLAIKCAVPVLSATQAATDAEAKQDKQKPFGKFDIYGSKRKVHACNVLIYIIQTGQDEDQLKSRGKGGNRAYDYECDWFWDIQIAKNRDGPTFKFTARQHVLTGKVSQINETQKNMDTITRKAWEESKLATEERDRRAALKNVASPAVVSPVAVPAAKPIVVPVVAPVQKQQPAPIVEKLPAAPWEEPPAVAQPVPENIAPQPVQAVQGTEQELDSSNIQKIRNAQKSTLSPDEKKARMLAFAESQMKSAQNGLLK